MTIHTLSINDGEEATSMWPCAFCTNDDHCNGNSKQCACPCYLILVMRSITNSDHSSPHPLAITAIIWLRYRH
jgi:hypothetical protein